MKKTKKHYSSAEKVVLLRRHLEQREGISTLCEEQELRPTVFYRWKKEFFEGGAAAFDRQSHTETVQLRQQLNDLKQEIARKNEIIAEVLQELVQYKKILGVMARLLDRAESAG
jgi:transposase